eukprot:1010235-Amorphochlora_amoeboformis.AAC.1
MIIGFGFPGVGGGGGGVVSLTFCSTTGVAVRRVTGVTGVSVSRDSFLWLEWSVAWACSVRDAKSFRGLDRP